MSQISDKSPICFEVLVEFLKLLNCYKIPVVSKEASNNLVHTCGLLVSTYIVCERLSVMHEPAGVVENLVQNPQNTPYSEVQFQNTPPSQ